MEMFSFVVDVRIAESNTRKRNENKNNNKKIIDEQTKIDEKPKYKIHRRFECALTVYIWRCDDWHR